MSLSTDSDDSAENTPFHMHEDDHGPRNNDNNGDTLTSSMPIRIIGTPYVQGAINNQAHAIAGEDNKIEAAQIASCSAQAEALAKAHEYQEAIWPIGNLNQVF